MDFSNGVYVKVNVTNSVGIRTRSILLFESLTITLRKHTFNQTSTIQILHTEVSQGTPTVEEWFIDKISLCIFWYSGFDPIRCPVIVVLYQIKHISAGNLS